MQFAILAYHDPADIKQLSQEEDDALMADLYRAHERINETGKLGPAARLDYTSEAVTLRGLSPDKIIDGPFAETKEALLGLYVVDVASREAAIEAARELKKVNPSAVYEIRPVTVYLPGVPIG